MKTKSKHVRDYRAKNGATQYKPSLQMAMAMNGCSEGFCLACAHVQSGVEPDAKRYVCNACNAPKVYGAESLVMMGLTFDAEA